MLQMTLNELFSQPIIQFNLYSYGSTVLLNIFHILTGYLHFQLCEQSTDVILSISRFFIMIMARKHFVFKSISNFCITYVGTVFPICYFMMLLKFFIFCFKKLQSHKETERIVSMQIPFTQMTKCKQLVPCACLPLSLGCSHILNKWDFCTAL